MCIGIPMQVCSTRPDRAQVVGRHGKEVVDTRLVGPVDVGDWLLIFQGAAREKLSAERAAEIASTLQLLEAGLAGDHAGAGANPGFVLPSAMTAAQLAQLSGTSVEETAR